MSYPNEALATGLMTGLGIATKGYQWYKKYKSRNALVQESLYKPMANVKRKRTSKKLYRKYKNQKSKGKRNIASSNKMQLLQKDISFLKKQAKDQSGRLTYRTNIYEYVKPTSIACEREVFDFNDALWIEAVIAQLRYFDPANPGTLVVGSGATGSYNREFRLVSSKMEVTIRNNYQVPFIVEFMVAMCEQATNISPNVLFADQIADQTNTTYQNPRIGLQDCVQQVPQYKTHGYKKFVLEPGVQKVFTLRQKGHVTYNPIDYDNNADKYKKNWQSGQIMFKLIGVVAHDTTVGGQVGIIQCGADFMCTRETVVEYQAGSKIDYLYVYDDSAVFTNAGVCSNMPTADNQIYSQA